MNKKFFDKNFVIALLAGGFGIMLYDVLQLSFKFWFTDTVSFDDYKEEFFPKAFAGIAVLVFALIYAISTRKK